MNNNNSNRGQKQRSKAAKKSQAQLKAEILNELRAAAGVPAKGKGRGKANRQAKQAAAAAAYATGQSGHGAKIQADAETCRVQHREFIGNVTGSVAFSIASTFALNPGLATTFPWLAGIAQNWEAYRFRKLRFCYYTRTGTGVPGSVIMAHDPDSSDAAPVTEQVMTTYEKCEEDAPWKDICMDLSKMALHDVGPRKFVRTGGLAANQDIKLYDSGNVYIGTVDGTAVAWGKLWVEYDVDFYTPQLPASGGLDSATLTNTAGTGVATSNPFGTAQTVLGSYIASAGASSFSLQNLDAGSEYVIAYSMTTTGSSTPGIWTTPVGCTIKNQAALAGTAAGIVNWVLTITATASVATLVPVFTLAGTASNVFVVVAKVPTSAL